MTQERLRERLVYWQRVLRLQDWRITVRYVDEPHQFKGPEALTLSGQVVTHSKVYRTASIAILRPDHPDLAQRPDAPPETHGDVEQILVHELLHVMLHAGDACPEMQETACELLAWALIRLDRRTVAVDGHAVAVAVCEAMTSSLAEPAKRCTSCFHLFTARGSLCDQCAKRLSSTSGAA